MRVAAIAIPVALGSVLGSPSRALAACGTFETFPVDGADDVPYDLGSIWWRDERCQVTSALLTNEAGESESIRVSGLNGLLPLELRGEPGQSFTVQLFVERLGEPEPPHTFSYTVVERMEGEGAPSMDVLDYSAVRTKTGFRFRGVVEVTSQNPYDVVWSSVRATHTDWHVAQLGTTEYELDAKIEEDRDFSKCARFGVDRPMGNPVQQEVLCRSGCQAVPTAGTPLLWLSTFVLPLLFLRRRGHQ